MNKFKVLFIAAHPDDIDYGCSVSLYNHFLHNDDITVLVLTHGEKGGNPDDRIIEQSNSLKILASNCKKIILNYADTQLYLHSSEIIEQIRLLVLDYIPDVVYIHSPKDSHQDHVTTYSCAIAAINNIKVKQIISYETPSTLSTFSPNLFRIFDNRILKIKLHAIRCHKSQITKPYFSSQTIIAISKMRAIQAKHYGAMAEAYEILKTTEI